MDTGDILLIIYFALITLLVILPCIIGCIVALFTAASVFEICFLIFIIIGLVAIDGGLWWLFSI